MPISKRIPLIIIVASACITAGWLVVFASGSVARRVRFTPTTRPAAARTGMPWKYGDTLPRPLVNGLTEELGHFRALLVVGYSDTMDLKVALDYLAVLRQRYGTVGLRAVSVFTGDKASPSLDAVAGPLGRGAPASFTLVLDSAGHVVYALAATVPLDNLRQLVERTLTGEVKTIFPDPPLDPDTWTGRLRSGAFRRVDGVGNRGGPTDPLHAWHVVVFGASPPLCQVASDLRLVRALRTRLGRRSDQHLAIVVPPHYLHPALAPLLDSLDATVFVSDPAFAPELAYLTRPGPLPLSVVLELDKGRVRRVSRIEGRGT